MDYILDPSFSKKIDLKSKFWHFFRFFPKIGNFWTLKLEKKFFEDLNQKCNTLCFKILWRRLV